MGTVKAVLDTTQYVKVNSVKPGSFIIQSHRDTVRIAFSDVKPARSNGAFHELGGALKESVLNTGDIETDVWILAMTDSSSVTITDQFAPSVQYPLSTDGDSVYCKDVWQDVSVTTDWLDIDSSGEDIACIPFTNLHTRIENSTADNPKEIIIHFNRTVSSSAIGFGCTGGGDFSNIKVILIASGGVERMVVDDSLNDEKLTSKVYAFTQNVFNAVRVEFHTVDPVCISNFTIAKSRDVSISQVDPTTDALKVINYSHAELHSGDHYVYREYHTILKGGISEHLIITPDIERWAHMTIGVDAVDSSVVVEMFEDVTYTTQGTLETVRNRNRNYPDNNTTLIYEDPTGLVTNGRLSGYWLGAGKNSGGGETRDSEEVLLKQNTTYLIRITEQNIQTTVVNLVFDWYEHTNKNVS